METPLIRTLFFSPLARVLHFLFAFSLVIVFATKESNEFLWLHANVGLVMGLVVLVRILLFFIGEKSASLKSFDLRLSSLKNYIVDYFHFKSTQPRNPAASYSAIVLWIFALASILSGLLFVGAKYGSGVFSSLYFGVFAHQFKELHEFFGNAMFVVAGFHIAGVIAEHFLKKTTIAKAMLDGKIQLNEAQIKHYAPSNSPYVAILAAFLLIGIGVYFSTIQTNPLLDSKNIHQNYAKLAPTLTKECVECHMFYPPNLYSKNNQLQMIDNLSNHYGTDASLDEESLKAIKEEINHLAVSTSRFKFEEIGLNQSITTTKRYEKLHKNIDKEWLTTNKIKKTDCKACHIHIEKGSISPFELKYTFYNTIK